MYVYQSKVSFEKQLCEMKSRIKGDGDVSIRKDDELSQTAMNKKYGLEQLNGEELCDDALIWCSDLV